MPQTKRKFTYRHSDGRTEPVSCSYDPDAELWLGFTANGQRVYFEPNGEQWA